MRVSTSRRMLGTVAGLVAGFAVVFAVELIGARLYPPPPGFDPKNPEAVKHLMAMLPMGAFVLVMFAYLAASLVGALVATRVSHTPVSGWVVGAVMLAATIANLVAMPHPTWFAAACVGAVILGTWMGGRMGRRIPTKP
jgi:hypothetical protein